MNLTNRIKLLSDIVETIEEIYDQGELKKPCKGELENPMRPRYLRLIEWIAELKQIQEKISKFGGMTLIGYRKNDDLFIEISP